MYQQRHIIAKATETTLQQKSPITKHSPSAPYDTDLLSGRFRSDKMKYPSEIFPLRELDKWKNVQAGNWGSSSKTTRDRKSIIVYDVRALKAIPETEDH